MCDDAFITLRTVDNFIQGYGLVWNVGERVQAYTHPLWMFVLSFCYALTHEPYFTTLAVSAILSLSVVSILLWTSRSNLFALLLLGIMLIGSKAFVDYSTSGLENALAHLLLVVFFVILLRDQQLTIRAAYPLAITAGLLMLNRLDHSLLVIPALFATALGLPRCKGFVVLLLAGIPVIAWSIFSLIYYGFPFPNTFYAKQAAGIPRAEYIDLGLLYLADTAVVDAITMLGLLLGIGSAVLQQQRRFLAAAIGILLYVFYVLWIGGDFMGGRMFSAPFVSALAILAVVKPTPKRLVLKFCILLLSIIFFAVNRPYLLSAEPLRGALIDPIAQTLFDTPAIFGKRAIADERGIFSELWLLPTLQGKAGPDKFGWARIGRRWREQKINFRVSGAIGGAGYYAGQQTYIIDPLALSDAFLARIGPRSYPKEWRAGHIPRPIPDGYLMTKLTGENHLRDPELAELYERLLLVISGPLLDARRWDAIIDLNTRPLPFAFLDDDQLDYDEVLFRGTGISVAPNEQVHLTLDASKPERRLFIRTRGGYRIQFKRQAGQTLVGDYSVVAQDDEDTMRWFDAGGIESVHIAPLSSQQAGLVVYFAIPSPPNRRSPQTVKTSSVETNMVQFDMPGVGLDNLQHSPLWVKQTERGLMLFLKVNKLVTHTLDIQAWPLCPPGKTQFVKLWLNGRQIAEHQWTNCQERWVEQVRIPVEWLLPGWNLMEAEAEHGSIPAQIIPGSQDKRTLYVAFERLLLQAHDLE
jgi:arabinofuranosyltransferase